MTRTKPTEELERLFGSHWSDAIDEMNDQEPMMVTYREPITFLGFSYRHGVMCAYVTTANGERKTIPLSDIELIERDIFPEEDTD